MMYHLDLMHVDGKRAIENISVTGLQKGLELTLEWKAAQQALICLWFMPFRLFSFPKLIPLHCTCGGGLCQHGQSRQVAQ